MTSFSVDLCSRKFKTFAVENLCSHQVPSLYSLNSALKKSGKPTNSRKINWVSPLNKQFTQAVKTQIPALDSMLALMTLTMLSTNCSTK